MRLVDQQTQSNLGGREGTAMLGTKRGRSRRGRTSAPRPKDMPTKTAASNPEGFRLIILILTW